MGPRAWSLSVLIPISPRIRILRHRRSELKHSRIRRRNRFRVEICQQPLRPLSRYCRCDGAVFVDVGDRAVKVVDDLYSEGEIKIFQLSNRLHWRESPYRDRRSLRNSSSPRSSTPFAESVSAIVGEELGCDILVNEQGFQCIADRRFLALGIDCDRLGHVEIGSLIDVDVQMPS